MKYKHNKKRNTAFLYEVLVRELTKKIIEKDQKGQKAIVETIKRFFSKGCILAEELKFYNFLLKTDSLDNKAAEKVIYETRVYHSALDKKTIFNEQSKMISIINKIITKDTWENYVPNYKNMATVSQIFYNPQDIPSRVILESTLVENLSAKSIISEEDAEPKIRNSVVTSFVKIFNEQYSGLLEEQKKLLEKYIISVNNPLDFKLFLSEEVDRIKGFLKQNVNDKDLTSNEMQQQYSKVITFLEGLSKKDDLLKEDIENIMSIQQLVKDMGENAKG
jgi:hypothetical protein